MLRNKIFVTIIAILLIYGVAMLSVSKDKVKQYDIKKYDKQVIMDKNNKNEAIDIEEFVPCVVMSIIPIDGDDELIKMQMVITRTYILKKMGDKDSIKASELNVNYLTYNEMEQKWGTKFVEKYNKLIKLVYNTNKQVITYKEKLIMPYFHVLSAGKTRNGKEVLGDNYAYMESVECKKDLQAKDYLSIEYIEIDDFIKKLKKYDDKINMTAKDFFDKFEITKRDSAGYVLEVKADGKVMTAQEFANYYELNSTYFTVEKYPSEDKGTLRIVVKGKGEGLGVSLNGAYNMAEEGKSYKEILEYYYKNVVIG